MRSIILMELLSTSKANAITRKWNDTRFTLLPMLFVQNVGIQRQNDMVALLTNPKTGEIYEFVDKTAEGYEFRNLTADKVGVVSKEVAQKNLKVSVHLNQLANENPLLMELIRGLNLGVIVSPER